MLPLAFNCAHTGLTVVLTPMLALLTSYEYFVVKELPPDVTCPLPRFDRTLESFFVSFARFAQTLL
jgi:hypothetical protein